MKISLFQRRTVWAPTAGGWLLLFLIGGGVLLGWILGGEYILSPTLRPTPEIMVVEGWISTSGFLPAAEEYRHGGYHLLVTTGGPTGLRQEGHAWNFAEIARLELIRLGVPANQVIAAPPIDVENQRTFKSAAAVWRALQSLGLQPTTVTVFTRGVHARRSRMVYAKVFGPKTQVGVIAWTPPEYQNVRWWHSSERGSDLIKESFGSVFEFLFDSGRASNSPLLKTSLERSPRQVSARVLFVSTRSAQFNAGYNPLSTGRLKRYTSIRALGQFL